MKIDESIFGKMKYGRGIPVDGKWAFEVLKGDQVFFPPLEWLRIERRCSLLSGFGYCLTLQ